ncbi:CRISPR-associated endonuclease Cas1 [Arcicella sp. LKC2W]|uniref:CRISPR-associated endonuclease Cas1 n=1 Tax=Arcicella sp. LKC2W TaxID=2984198 RepID=UPI002B1ED7E5|nr:CRISPR-associated endonuclease Cas1 [Arcicella sp. LKC2W]MEA5461612.1 CRISPR-associated endonuclease Cas1 [Arcicella sp. LKC2W]
MNQRGSSLSVKNGRYCIRSGENVAFVSVHEVKVIHLHSATKLSFEVVQTALDHHTDVLFVNRKGHPIGRLWGNTFGSISTIRKNQLKFSQSSAGVEWVRTVLKQKAENQSNVLELLSLLSEIPIDILLQKINRYAEKFVNFKHEDFSETFASFRGFEGSCSKYYFEGIKLILPQKYRFERRSQHPALDMFNCLLNYGYGMLYAHCESALIRAGIDPAIGVMHRDEYNRPVLVYDFIEKFRHWIDYVVCHLCLQEVIFEEFFDVENQQFWLNTYGKRILIQSINEYLEELINLEGLSRSRLNHLELEAQRLASMLKKI